MELNKNNESKNRGGTTASSVLLAGLILCTLVIVIFSYATSNHIISNATAQNTPPKKVLIVTTSHNILGKTGYPTGLWLPEMTHPFSALQNAGFNITVAGAILMIVQSVNAQSQNDTAQ